MFKSVCIFACMVCASALSFLDGKIYTRTNHYYYFYEDIAGLYTQRQNAASQHIL